MATKIALMGAGGKMGCRILNNLKEDPNAYRFFILTVMNWT